MDLHPGEYALLIVADTGVGIEKAFLDKIFDPYFTTKAKDKGTGLGLSVVQGIVKSCQGDIYVTSDSGKGTEVQVYLPLIHRNVPEKVEADQVEPIPLGREKILLVDDEEAIVRFEKQMLEHLGYKVTPCSGSKEAIETFNTDPMYFDLVFTDMTMPEMTGTELAHKIRSSRPDIPIIICTGFNKQITADKCKEMNIQALVHKPIVMREIANTIREVLDRQKGEG